MNNGEKLPKELLETQKRFNPKYISFYTALIYVIIGSLWVLLSDRFLEATISDKKLLISISLLKGWIYTFVTGIIIFLLTYSPLKKVKKYSKEIIDNYNELSSTYDDLEVINKELSASEVELRDQFDNLMLHQRLLEKSEERYRLISEGTNDAIWEEVDNKTYFSDRWFEITGYTPYDIDNMHDWKELVHPEDLENIKSKLNKYLNKKSEYYNAECRLKKKDGNYIWIQSRGKAVFDKDGNMIRMVGSHTDITKLKEYQKQLKYMAFNDVLTGLPNRQALYLDIPQIISNSKKQMALIFIDIDNFKLINDTMGHYFGDLILKQVGEKLSLLITKDIVLYRLGGDEFIITATNIEENNCIKKLANSIYKIFEEPIVEGGNNIHINISSGIALYPKHGDNIDELMRRADIAMYRAKKAGKNSYKIYTQFMDDKLEHRVLIEELLRNALKNNEMEVYYQPQLDLKENKITGLEALLRWNNAKLGAIPPNQFISIAEDTHIIINLGKWVLNKACYFLKKLHNQGNSDLTMSVNISIIQLLDNEFSDTVTKILKKYKLNPKYLELDITETLLIESYELIKNQLDVLRILGIKIALDDFGKGYSSLNSLKQLPINTLKIDKSFIDDIICGTNDKTLSGHIITMGRHLGLNVVAEGVENKVQLDYLKSYKCDKIQGYLFSRPLPEDEVKKLLE